MVTRFLFFEYFFETVAILLFDDFCFFPFFTFTVIVCPTRTVLADLLVFASGDCTDEAATHPPATAMAARMENVFFMNVFIISLFPSFAISSDFHVLHVSFLFLFYSEIQIFSIP
jgi:hypothetical protein